MMLETITPLLGRVRNGVRGCATTALLLALILFFARPAQAAITVVRTSGTTFYTDTSTTAPGIPKCGYVSFNITSSTALSDAWAGIGAFTGGSFSLGGGDDGIFHFGPFLAGQTKPVFFYLCSSYTPLNNSSAQTYQVRVYNGNPSAGGTPVDAGTTLSTTINNDVIQANPNQVNVIISGPNPATLGGVITMTVDGDTGTTGCVNPPSACTGGSGSSGPLAFTPATFTSWRADGFEMVGSNVTLSGANSGSYDNILYLDTVAESGNSHYLATYYFRAVSSTGLTTTLSPVSYLASGTQIKHTSLTSGAYSVSGGLQPVESPQASVVLSKTVSHATLPAQGGRVTYTLSAVNSGLEGVSLDSFVDVLPSGASYVAGSSTYNGAALPDPAMAGSTLTWSSLFAIAAGSSRNLVFQADLPAVPGSYTNSATARIGSSIIDSTLQVTDNVPASASTVVLLAPTITKSFSPNSLAVNGVAAMTLSITNPNTGAAMNGIAVSDTLPASPAGLVFALPSAAATSCSGATLSVTGSTIAITGGTLAAGQSCTVSANVTSASVNTSYTNTTGTVSSTNCGTGGTASASLNFTAKPTIAKSFAVASIPRNGSAAMTITITSPVPLTGVTFDDLFPAGLVTANPPSVSPATPCGGTLGSWNGISAGVMGASGGDPGIRLTGGAIATAGGSCSFTVNVSAAAAGLYANTTGGVNANETGGIAGPASNTATLSVLSGPAVVKAFSPSTIGKGQSSTLSVTLSNANATAITGVAFTDSFPGGLTSSATPNPGTDCPSGSVSFTGGSLSLSGATIPANSSCSVTINVTSNTVNPGYLNTLPAGSVTSVNAGSNAAAASATLTVNATPAISKSFSFNAATGVATMTLTITNNHTAGITGLSFSDLFPAGMSTANPVALSPATPCGSGSTLQSWNGSSAGTLSATGGNPGILLSGGQIPAGGGSCSFSVNLLVSALGVYVNQSSGVSLTGPFTGTGSPSNSAVWIAPFISKTLTPNTIGPGDTSRMEIRITNPSLSTSLTGLSLNDVYPTSATRPDGSTLSAAMTNSANPNVVSNCGGTVTAAANGTGITLSGGSLAASGVCTFAVDVQAVNTTPATYYNSSGRISSDQGVGSTGSDALYLVTKPTITKTFLTTPATISGATATSVMRISIKNNSGINISGVSLTDAFPALPSQMKWVNTVANSCGGTLTDAAGAALVSNSSTGIKLSNGAVSAAAGSCSIDVTVSVSATGSYDNTTSGATSSANASPGPPSNKATLTAYLSAPSVAKSFASSAFQTGGANRLSITLTNPNPAAILGVTFTDLYPANLYNAALPNLSSDCGGTATAAPGSGTLSLAGGSIPASGSCSLSVDLTTAVAGSYTNTLGASAISASNANPAPQAGVSASCSAFLPPSAAKFFGAATLPVGAATTLALSLTNPAANSAPLTGVQLDDSFPAGLTLQNAAFSFAPAACGTVTRSTGAPSAGGDTAVRFSVASLTAGASCQVSLNVTSSSVGSITNATSAPTATGPAALTGSSANAPLTFYGLPLIAILKSADKASADPGQAIVYTIRVVNTGTGPGASVVLTDELSPYGSFFLGAGAPFSFSDGFPASGIGLGAAQYSNNHGASWAYAPVSQGGGAPAGYDGAVTSWRIPMTGTIKAGGSFLLNYRIVVK